ncbi:hypothetical protein PISL3812_06314 [Talaromyces islandicus]|uniref:Uncharacterized protein n=1 Tax=Talaromyces islandicus TaxID=28573 RepID=A0A0U1M124_TALIS|nr:hypothetical protein PISL3812_06314 [Talaromyces islandicus]
MAPIRVGIIGLTTVTPLAQGYTPGSWGLVHLSALSKSPHYKIVALCNSTAEKARKSIQENKLDPATKAYGSAEELAQDPDVDLVVVSVNVDKHYSLAKPALLNKKSIFVEFPLSASYPEVEELVKLAEQGNVKTVVGAQARGSHAFAKVSELVKSKVIGDVISTSWVSHMPLPTSDGLLESLKDFAKLDGGPSRVNIGLGHGLDPFLHAVGEFKTVQAVFKIHANTIPLFDSTGKVVDPEYKVTAPDYILIQGVLESGAVASINVRFGATSADDASIRWIISGTEGEIAFTAPPESYVQTDLAQSKVVVKKWKGEAEEIDFKRDEPTHISAETGHVVNTARLYESFATGNEDGYPSFESARKVHNLIEQVKKVAVWAP